VINSNIQRPGDTVIDIIAEFALGATTGGRGVANEGYAKWKTKVSVF
jgi:hypothetical protein